MEFPPAFQLGETMATINAFSPLLQAAITCFTSSYIRNGSCLDHDVRFTCLHEVLQQTDNSNALIKMEDICDERHPHTTDLILEANTMQPGKQYARLGPIPSLVASYWGRMLTNRWLGKITRLDAACD